jgi:mannose-6-phosphate isomerase-like protein (cupin superfamily)
MAQDPVEVAPDVYRVLFENERVRLLEVREGAGQSTAMHSHPDYLVYAVQGGTVRLTSASGDAAEVEISAGDVMWRDAEEHSTENVGTTELHAIFFELK